MWRYHAKKMFKFVLQTLQNKWNKICMKQLVGGKHMENDCFPRTLKFEMVLEGLNSGILKLQQHIHIIQHKM
jgi:hypothetical protein